MPVNQQSQIFPRLKPQALPVQILDLTLIQLSNYRWSWRSMLITGMIAPLVSIAALGLFARQSGAQVLGYILTGNLVMSLMFEIQGKVCSNFAFMRTKGTFSYFASLPIQRFTLVLATVVSYLILSIPSLLIIIVAGSLYLGISIHPHPILLVAIPLIAIPMAGIGAWIGVSTRTPEESGPISLLVTFIAVGLGPVVIPPEQLPQFMILLGRLSPATYAASALRQTLLGPLTPQIIVDLLVLCLFSALFFWLALMKMEWRQV
ncbi:MAG: ABC transporter permease [Anaerolineales bacterium]|nr:ABC transporter permease [Anaerolineales bacterium]